MGMTAVERARRSADRARAKYERAIAAEIAETKVVGQMLTRARIEQNITREELSDMVTAGLEAYSHVTVVDTLGYDERRIRRYERGMATPRGNALTVLCEVLGLDVAAVHKLRRRQAEIQDGWYKVAQRDRGYFD